MLRKKTCKNSSVKIKSYKIQFITFKALSYCFEETIGFEVKASFARCPVSRLIKPGDITKEFYEKTIQFHGLFKD